MNTTAQLDALKSRVGFHEIGTNGNPFGPWQGIGSGFAWCDSFAQWGAVGNGGFRWQDSCQFGFRGDSYCPYTIDHAKELGIWKPASSNPSPGWQVLFDWEHNGVADHIGTVISNGWQSDGSIVTVEGNVQDQVMFVKRDHTYILGFVALTNTGKEEEDMTGDQAQQLNEVLADVKALTGWFSNNFPGQGEPNFYNASIENYRNLKALGDKVNLIKTEVDQLKAGGGSVDIDAVAKAVADELENRLQK